MPNIGVYRALVVEGGMYLPPEKETPMMFISQIAVGDKRVGHFQLLLLILLISGAIFKSDRCKNSSASERSPFKRSSQVHDKELDGKEYLPDSYADYMPNRIWMANLCLILQHYFLIGNSLNGDKFHVFIQEKLGKRRQEILKNKKYTMNMISSFSYIFDRSQIISSEFSIVSQ